MKLTARLIRTLSGASLVLLLLGPGNAIAQSWIVSYFETLPAAAGTGAETLGNYAGLTRDIAGNTGVIALQQRDRLNQFVLLESWVNDEARAAQGASRAVAELRAALQPVLISGYDERMYTGPGIDGRLAAGAGAVYVVTHIDIGSRPRETGIDLVNEMAHRGQQDEGNSRLMVLSWGQRNNHMSVVEVWESDQARQAHLATDHMRQFRTDLTPLIGSMYDERVYTAIGSAP